MKPPAKESSRNTVSVKVVDCSGKGAGSDAAARLAAMGFEVIDGGSDPERDQTTVVSTTSNGRVVSRLSAVPFPYTLRILRADDASYDAVILSVKIINKPLSNAGKFSLHKFSEKGRKLLLHIVYKMLY